MKFPRRVAILTLATAAFALAQFERPKFEVVAVKPCKTGPPAPGRKGSRGGNISATPGRLTVECATLRTLIRSAYIQFPGGERVEFVSPRVMQQDIKGGPSWIDSERLTIEAKAEGPVSADVMRGPMLQALLEDRFQLKIRREPREVSVYELVVAAGGPKLRVAKPGSCMALDRDHVPPEPDSGRSLPKLCGVFSGEYMYGTSMATFCRQLTAILDRDVVDRTGLTGVYDIHLFGLPDVPPPSPDGAPPAMTLASALEATIPRLGLKLEPAKSAVEFLVIDHVEKPAI